MYLFFKFHDVLFHGLIKLQNTNKFNFDNGSCWFFQYPGTSMDIPFFSHQKKKRQKKTATSSRATVVFHNSFSLATSLLVVRELLKLSDKRATYIAKIANDSQSLSSSIISNHVITWESGINACNQYQMKPTESDTGRWLCVFLNQTLVLRTNP